jgi:xylan 1,4-beta-xylosidase
MTYGLESDLPLPKNGRIFLGVDVRLAELQFRWSEDGVTWTPVGPVLDASILSDEAGPGAHGSFTGAFVGMAAHDMTGRALPADFDHFAYREDQSAAD